MSIGKHLKAKSSDMRHRIVVKRRTTTTDDDGGVIEGLTVRFASEPAKFEKVSGGEFLRGRKIDVQTTAIFTVNYRAGYHETDTIEYSGKSYGIVSIDMPEGVNRFIEIQAKVAK